jgi:acyl-coenzyme A thioesterase PaaI-like protein
MAFAAAGNSRGQTAVALNMTISFLRVTQVCDTLVAEAKEQALNGPIGLYDITENLGQARTNSVKLLQNGVPPATS